MEQTNYICSSSTIYNEEPHHNVNFIPEYRSLGLKFTITPEFIAMANAIPRRGKDRLTDNIVVQPVPEKIRATNFRASSLTIGNWQILSQRDDNLVCKFYYNKKKIVWEILKDALKKKMETTFSNIIAIQATVHANGTEELKIELNMPPDFAVEAPPQPRKHTIWEPNAPDFTNHQALFYRRHVVTCKSGNLIKHYNTLLQSDVRLRELSKMPFPTEQNPTFALDDVVELNLSSQNIPPTFALDDAVELNLSSQNIPYQNISSQNLSSQNLSSEYCNEESTDIGATSLAHLRFDNYDTFDNYDI